MTPKPEGTYAAENESKKPDVVRMSPSGHQLHSHTLGNLKYAELTVWIRVEVHGECSWTYEEEDESTKAIRLREVEDTSRHL